MAYTRSHTHTNSYMCKFPNVDAYTMCLYSAQGTHNYYVYLHENYGGDGIGTNSQLHETVTYTNVRTTRIANDATRIQSANPLNTVYSGADSHANMEHE